jgi:glycosyltransferase involved in cell wall biosynthesis
MISVIIITKNEEDNITRAIESVKWAGEIIVVDSGSTDRTIELAAKAGAKTYNNKWNGYGKQKNFAAGLASGDWILSLDADEVISSKLADEITSAAKNPGRYTAYRIPRRLVFLDRVMRWGGTRSDCQLRLFRKGSARFTEEPVHEKLVTECAIGILKGYMLHYSYRDLSDYFDRFNRYTQLDARKRFEAGRKFHFWLYFQPGLKFFGMYVLRLGFLDGWRGFLWAALGAFYNFVKFMKLKELWRQKNGEK